VDGAGAVSAAGPGTAWLVATAGSARDSVLITTAVPIAAVDIAEADVELEIGASRTLSASVLGPGQQRIDRAVTWSSSDPGVVTVDPGSGRVAAVAAGVAQVTASVETFTDRITVTVAEPAPALPSSATVESALQAYVASLSARDGDAVTALWGGGDQGARDDLLELMDERDFSASLGPFDAPAQQGDAVVVRFQAAATYRTNFGNNRDRSLTFQARFQRAGSEWRLASCVLVSGGAP
jgi:hypothetical protein